MRTPRLPWRRRSTRRYSRQQRSGIVAFWRFWPFQTAENARVIFGPGNATFLFGLETPPPLPFSSFPAWRIEPPLRDLQSRLQTHRNVISGAIRDRQNALPLDIAIPAPTSAISPLYSDD